jgi:hypothetical protein
MAALAVVVCLIAFTMTPFGCAVANNLSNRGALTDHMRAIFHAQGVELKKLDCSMIDTTRRGSCDFDANQADIDKLVKGIPLMPLRKYADRAKSPDDVYVSAERLSTPIEPSRFDYLVIYFDPHTKRASASTCFSFG